MKCPICGRVFSSSVAERSLPFCSLRCKQIDAKRWLNEEYSVAKLNLDALEKEIAGWEEAKADLPEKN